MSSFRQATFAELIAHLNYPMIVVTTASAGRRAGCLVGFHSQCSIQPERFAIWLSKANYTYRAAVLAETFAVHALEDANRDLAELFGSQTEDATDKFDRCRWVEGPDGVPLLDDCPNRFISRRIGLFDHGGDHVCVIVEAVQAEGAIPFNRLSFQQVRHLTAGHDADEQPGAAAPPG
jgi:flavin reductase (DIM6/NTAB) family NADH-FMN oxidoreductase RutF